MKKAQREKGTRRCPGRDVVVSHQGPEGIPVAGILQPGHVGGEGLDTVSKCPSETEKPAHSLTSQRLVRRGVRFRSGQPGQGLEGRLLCVCDACQGS